MAQPAFDTLKFADTLMKAGFTQEQAKGLSEAENKIWSESLDSQLATKMDITRLDAKLDRLDSKVERLIVEVKSENLRIETTLGSEIKRVETELKADIGTLGSEIKRVETTLGSEIKRVETELNGKFRLMYWMLGFSLAGTVGILGLLLKLFVQ